MSSAKGFDAILSAIAGARRAQHRQTTLIREMLARQNTMVRELIAPMVTREEFNDAMQALGEALRTIDEATAAQLDTVIAALRERPTP
jgi:hypothetical protein